MNKFSFLLLALLHFQSYSKSDLYDQLLTEVTLNNNYIISDSFDLFENAEHTVLIPLNSLSKLLGFIISKNQSTFELKFLSDGKLKSFTLESCPTQNYLSEHLIDINCLGKIVKIEFQYDPKKLILNIYPSYEIDYLNKFINQSENEAPSDDNSELLVVAKNIKKKSFGILEQNIDLSRNKNSVSTNFIANYGQFDLKSSFTNFVNQELTLTKKRPLPFNFLGININNLQIGKIKDYSIPELSLPGVDYGIYISNLEEQTSLKKTTEFELYTGKGWIAELRQENILIKKVNSNQEGIIIFSDILINIGNNNFEIYLFGPNGEYIKKEKNIYLPRNFSDNSRYYFSSSISKLDDSTKNIKLNGQKVLSPNLLIGNKIFINSNREKSNTNTVALEVSSYYNNFIIGVEKYYQNKKRSMTKFSVGNNGRNINSSTQYTKYQNFNKFQNEIHLNKWELKSDVMLRLPSLASASQKISLEIQKEKDYNRSLDFQNTFTFSGVLHTTTINNLDNSKQYNITQGARFFLKSFTLQDEITWHKFSNTLSNNLDVSLYISENLHLFSQFTYNPSSADFFKTGLSFTTQNFNTSLSYGTNLKAHQINASFSYSLINSSNGVYNTSGSIDNNSILSIFVFEDKNRNNILDTNEKLLPNSSVKLNNQSIYYSNSNGTIVVDKLTAYSKNKIELQLNSIEDINLKAENKSISAYVRPGVNNAIYFPLKRFLSIQFNINSKNQYKIKVFNNLNNEVFSSTSENESFLIWEEVEPGEYSFIVNCNKKTLTFKREVITNDEVINLSKCKL